MSPPTTPYMGITDPDDLEESKFSLEFARSLNTSEDSAPLMARSDENEKEHLAASSSQGRLETLGWMAANAIATIGIVFTNKSLFETSKFKSTQLGFAAYHFAITGIVLHILSRPRFGRLEAKKVKVLEMLPPAISLCMSVIVSNLSLAYSSVAYYQIVRALLTPCATAINYFLYKATVPRLALMALMPTCTGIAMVTYYSFGSGKGDSSPSTTTFGVIFAFAGVVLTALHTVWMAAVQRRHQLDGAQLLLNQAPLGAIILLYGVPHADTFPVWHELSKNTWGLLLLSGFFTCVLNVSCMHMTDKIGPVGVTILENTKTILIIAIGGFACGGSATSESVLSFLMAIVGILGFSIALLNNKA